MGGIRVLHNGINVTPQSLLSTEKAGNKGRKASGEATIKRPSVATGGGVAPRNKSSLSVEAMQHANATAARADGSHAGGKSPGRRKREGNPEEGGLTEDDLNAPITIRLSETPTMMLLEIRGSAVATDLRDFSRWCGNKIYLAYHSSFDTYTLGRVPFRGADSSEVSQRLLLLFTGIVQYTPAQ